MRRVALAVVVATGVVAVQEARAWTTLVGNVHHVMAEGALANPQSSAFLHYLGLDAGAIADYAQEHEPWDEGSGAHIGFWSMADCDGGVRYRNDRGDAWRSHNRDGRSWPGDGDRSVDVLGAVLHSASDSAVIMGYEPGNSWYSNSGYQLRFEEQANQGTATPWVHPTLPFCGGAWDPAALSAPAATEVQQLYLDTHATFLAWNALSDSEKSLGGQGLTDTANAAVATGKRFTEAALADFLSTVVMKPAVATLTCDQLQETSVTLNAGFPLDFHYQFDGDRTRTQLKLFGAITELGATQPLAPLALSGSTSVNAPASPGTYRAEAVADQAFFGRPRVVHGFDVRVVTSPRAALGTNATDSNHNGFADYDVRTESAPTIYERSTGEITHRHLEAYDEDHSNFVQFDDVTEFRWPFTAPGMYTVTTTVSNPYPGVHTSSATLMVEVLRTPDPPDAAVLPDAARPDSALPDAGPGPDASRPDAAILPDAASAADAGAADAGAAPDASDEKKDSGGCACGTSRAGPGSVLGLALLAAYRQRRRR